MKIIGIVVPALLAVGSLFFDNGLVPFFVLASAAIFLLGVDFNTRHRDYFQPYYGLYGLAFLYALSTLIHVTKNGVTIYGEVFTEKQLTMYVVTCLCGQLALAAGQIAASFLFRRPRTLPQVSVQAAEIESRQFRRSLGLTMIVIGTAFLPFYLKTFNFLQPTNYSENALTSRTENFGDYYAGLRGVFLVAAPVTLIVCWSALTLADRVSKPYHRGIAIVLLCAHILTSMLSGWRGVMMSAATVLLIAFNYRRRLIDMKTLLALSAVTYVVINGIAVARSQSSLSGFKTVLSDEYQGQGLSFLALENSGELATSTNLLRLIIAIDTGESEYQHGYMLVSQFGAFLPKFLFPDRPLFASELFVVKFYPGVYESGGGYGLFMYQDGYWDFGIAGVMVISAIYMVFQCWIYARLIKFVRTDFSVLLYATIYTQSILACARSGYVGSIKALLMAALPLFLVKLITDFVVRPREPMTPGRLNPPTSGSVPASRHP
ncbi:MAG: oligosaccharide repeat unit polymerase [Verrucomicrobia bacterium]|nr:oligosaccharide repeat unit polymerase [Verrucomicrobiota bacterium]